MSRPHAPIQPFLALVFLLLAAAPAPLGCASSRGGSGPYATQSEQSRDPAAAQRLSLEAAAILEAPGPLGPEDYARAEGLLRQALTADLYHGPAHNNLGIVYLKQSPPKLYEAAGEFEWARKLLPGHPDPRLNLALTMERAGRVDEAIANCRTALEVYPDHLASMQQLARLQVKHAKADAETPRLLSEIALRGSTPKWQEWARREMLRRGG